MTNKLTITTLNTRSIRQPDKRHTVFSILSHLPSDVVLLQECGIPFRELDGALGEEWRLGDSLWSGSNIARADGVGTLIKNPFVKTTSRDIVESGRILVTDLEVGGSPLRVINVYGPTSVAERVSLFTKLTPLLHCTMPVVVGGDFNCALRDEDRSKPRRDRSSTLLRSLIDDFSLCDAGGASPPQHTYVNSSGSSSSRIDMLLLSPGLRVHTYSTRAVHFSDHHMVTVSLVWEKSITVGKGLWRMNVSHLQDPQVRLSFSRRYLEWVSLKDLFDSPVEWWEMVKERVRGYFRAVGRRKAKERRAVFERHNAALQRLSLLQARGLDVSSEIAQARVNLTALYREERKKHTFRSKLQGLEEDEKCTRFFFRRARSKTNNISSLYNNGGVVVSGEAEVREVAREFYEGLYSERPSDGALMDTFLDGLDRRLGDEPMEEELSVEELTGAAHSMNHHKAPGPDGIPAEFYQAYWDLLKADVAEVFRAAYREGRLGASLRQSSVTLVPKKGDLKDLRNWRPINLLSVDYKIMAKALMRRFQGLITSVIGPDQTCSVQGRSINDNLLLVRDLIIHSGERRSPLCLLSLDQEKAFDRVSHVCLERVLERMNIPGPLLRWTKICLTDITGRVVVNQQPSAPFAVRSGVRQGCPLASLLYVIYLEPFLQAIRANPGVAGYPLPGAGGDRLKVMAYMDDITIVATDSRSIACATKALDDFCAATGALVNREKSEMFLSPCWSEELTASFPVRRNTIKLLGVTFQADGGGRISWEGALRHVQNKIRSWSARPLTMAGKILVLKAIVLPVLLYVGRVFPPDKATGKLITRLAFRFVWGSSMEKLKRVTLLKEERNGGRGVPDIVNIILVQGLAALVQNTGKVGKASGTFARYYATPFLRAMGLGVLDLTVPYSWDPPYVYRALKDFAYGTGLPRAGLTSWSYKVIMAHLRSGQTVALPRGGPDRDPQVIWANVTHKCLTNKQKDIAWMTAHRCLPTRTFMYRRHLALTDRCPHGCTDSEHIFHLFWECTVARRVWGLVCSSVSLSRFLPRSSLTAEGTLYGPPGGCKTIQLQRQWGITNTVKQVLWEARNIKVYQKTTVDLVTLRRRIQNLLQDGILVEIRKNKDLARAKWGVDHWKELII